jgi:glycerophosphoryl diester phosphodiesterase
MIDRLLSLTERAAIAHRGGAALRPENTLAAFDHAVALGCDGVECDVHLSRDGEPVVIHDATLDRTTSRTGAVGALTAAELARVDAGFRFGVDGAFPFRGQGLGVPTLAELLDRHPALAVVIEIKGDRAETAERVLAAIRNARAEARVIVGGFSQEALDVIRRLAPEVPTGASSDECRAGIQSAAAGQSIARGRFRVFQAPIRYDGQRAFGAGFVRAARAAGLPVQVWVVDDPAEMRELLDWGVTGLISDRPDVAANIVRPKAQDRKPTTKGQRPT